MLRFEKARPKRHPEATRENMSKRSLRNTLLPAALLATTLAVGGCYYPPGPYGSYYPGYGYYGAYGYPAYVGTGLAIGGWGWGCCGGYYGGWRGGYWGGGYWHGGGWGGWHGGGWGGFHGSAGFHGGGGWGGHR
jgi:hypothetical protein